MLCQWYVFRWWSLILWYHQYRNSMQATQALIYAPAAKWICKQQVWPLHLVKGALWVNLPMFVTVQISRPNCISVEYVFGVSSPSSTGTAPEIPQLQAVPSSTFDLSDQSGPSPLALAPNGTATSSSESEAQKHQHRPWICQPYCPEFPPNTPRPRTHGDSPVGCMRSLECRTGAEVGVLLTPEQLSVYGLRQQLVGYTHTNTNTQSLINFNQFLIVVN